MLVPALVAIGIVALSSFSARVFQPSLQSAIYNNTPKPFLTPTPALQTTPTPIIALLSPTPAEAASPTPQPTTTPQAPATSIPAQILNLTNWKLTLPIGSSGKPTEIKQPALSSYQIDPYFIALGNAVRFRAPVNGVTTSGSGYPRSELREMAGGGASQASWSSTSGTHTMFIDQAITALPKTKSHVVAGQVHDADDDVIVIRLESTNLYVNVDGKNSYTLDSSYTLGKRFTVKFVAQDGKTEIYYNSGAQPAYVLDKAYSGAYFKAGAYTQSNCSKEPSNQCNADNFGEVVIYKLDINHQ